MENKVQDIVCNNSSSSLVQEFEVFIGKKILQGWSLKIIQGSCITAIQNKIYEYNEINYINDEIQDIMESE